MKQLDKITSQKTNFSKWYTDVVKNGELIDYAPVKGTMIYRPNAYAIWENFQEIFNRYLKKNGISNLYMPSLIPKSLMDKESNHIVGFSPELATVTKVGNQDLNEDVYLRPTSEVLFAKYFKDHGKSYNDYPILTNQWANIFRWEKTTNPFLRNTEFLWQEGHTVHNDALEARRLTKKILKAYEKILQKYFAIPVIAGKKTAREKFAGACSTYSLEAMMKDGKALQVATSHYLAQNFAKAFDIRFKNKNNEFEFAYQTSWGISTRVIGALIMTHGDDHGVIIPPYIAPVQVDILEFNPAKDHKLSQYVKEVEREIARLFHVKVDTSKTSIGYKASQSEIKGTPLRIEIGPREFANQELTFVRRDTLEKSLEKNLDLKQLVKTYLKDIHNNLYNQALQRLEENTIFVSTYQEFKDKIKEKKFIKMYFCCTSEAEAIIQAETGATARCILTEGHEEIVSLPKDLPKKCAKCGHYTKRKVLFAKAY